MLDELHARDVALIRDASIEFSGGLTVLTGETGAGKTALLSAIKLLVGERADAGAVRQGASALEVDGRFFERGGDPDGVVVRRRVSADGRGRVEIDGSMASVRQLAAGVGQSVDLCGQHEHQRLLDVRSHVEMLDAWAGDEAAEALAAYQDALDAAREAAAELEQVRERGRSAGARLEDARYALRRIDEVDPKPGEYERLKDDLSRVEHAEALAEAANGARDLLAGDGGALDGLSSAAHALRQAVRYDAELGTFAQGLEGSIAEVEDVATQLRAYADRIDFDPGELGRMQARVSALDGILRRFGPRMEDVLAAREEAAGIVAAVSDGGESERRVERAAAEAEARLAKAARRLADVRIQAAPRLAEAVGAQMSRLEMGSAGLQIDIEELPRSEWTRQGPVRVEFLYRPASGLSARPLRKIASGGEVSRVMLASKVALGDADRCDTLVFDEVDAGVGGATAVALAAVLADLARTHQVIVVTHLAQVAVVADSHYLVRKSDGDVPETTITRIEGEARVAEIARMLSGDTSDASLAHAREMLSR